MASKTGVAAHGFYMAGVSERKKGAPAHGRHTHIENAVFFCILIGKRTEMCRIKKVRSPLGRNCGMYRKNMMFSRGHRDLVPCSCHAHDIPFPGDSILFRLPRSPSVPPAGTPSRNLPPAWPVLSLNNRKHPVKCSQPD